MPINESQPQSPTPEAQPVSSEEFFKDVGMLLGESTPPEHGHDCDEQLWAELGVPLCEKRNEREVAELRAQLSKLKTCICGSTKFAADGSTCIECGHWKLAQAESTPAPAEVGLPALSESAKRSMEKFEDEEPDYYEAYCQRNSELLATLRALREAEKKITYKNTEVERLEEFIKVQQLSSGAATNRYLEAAERAESAEREAAELRAALANVVVSVDVQKAKDVILSYFPSAVPEPWKNQWTIRITPQTTMGLGGTPEAAWMSFGIGFANKKDAYNERAERAEAALAQRDKAIEEAVALDWEPVESLAREELCCDGSGECTVCKAVKAATSMLKLLAILTAGKG